MAWLECKSRPLDPSASAFTTMPLSLKQAAEFLKDEYLVAEHKMDKCMQ